MASQSTQARQEKLSEHADHYSYKTSRFPARASAMTVTMEPSASRHYTGHQAGLHPEDTLYLALCGMKDGENQRIKRAASSCRMRVFIASDDSRNGCKRGGMAEYSHNPMLRPKI